MTNIIKYSSGAFEFMLANQGAVMRYAGFWPRLWAGLIDFLVFIPIIFLSIWIEGLSRQLAIFEVVFFSFFYALYNIYLHGHYGQTIGKMAARIKVVQLNGNEISYKHALVRHSVDLLCAFLSSIAQIIALTSISDSTYTSASDWISRSKLIQDAFPTWYNFTSIFEQVWIWSELIVLLFNKQRRAIHDFVAGTVVIHIEKA